MENLSHNQSKIFKGAGWIIGLLVSVVGALVVYYLSRSIPAAISASIPIIAFAGSGIENKLQRENGQIDIKKTKMMIASLLFGTFIFISLFIIVELL